METALRFWLTHQALTVLADSLVQHHMRDTNELSAAENEKILGGTLKRIFRWNP
jgi:hypothetical protein